MASAPHRGQLAGGSAAEVRASLRRIGLQVIDIKPMRRSAPDLLARIALLGEITSLVHQRAHEHFRGRRRLQRSELFDSLATMLSAGVPLLEAVETLIHSDHRRRRSVRTMLVELRETLRCGGSLAQAMRERPSWFEPPEVAMVEAGQHAGTLPGVLLSLAERHEHADALSHKLIGALAYPFLVLLVGLGVVVFLSVKTLPELAKILSDAKIPVPMLTQRVMGFGQLLAQHWLLIGVLGMLLMGGVMIMPAVLDRWRSGHRRGIRFGPAKGHRTGGSPGLGLPGVLRWPLLNIRRTLAVGGLSTRLAELMRSGVPMVEALRVLAPTVRQRSLRELLNQGADAVERGEELAAALSDERWFDAEFRRLLDIGQTSGELESMLDRIGRRSQRQARRLIDRLTALLEPAVILTLAVFVGVVVMSAVLPLLRLQEVL